MAGRDHPALLRRARARGRGLDVPAYVQALLEQTAENLERLQRILARGEEGRAQTSQAMMTLTERLDPDRPDARQPGADAAGRRAAGGARPGAAAAGRARPRRRRTRRCAATRNTEIYLSRMLEEMTTGRAQATAELRSEIKWSPGPSPRWPRSSRVSRPDPGAGPGAARRRRAGCVAGLCGRAVHPAHGHHLRPAGLRPGPGLPQRRLSSRDRALDRLNAQVAELAELLALERGQATSCAARSPAPARSCAPPPAPATC